jgi:hypothetical protein
MTYFLELTTQEGEFVVHHEKLIEYGISPVGAGHFVANVWKIFCC